MTGRDVPDAAFEMPPPTPLFHEDDNMYSRKEAIDLLKVNAEKKDYEALEAIILECKKDSSMGGIFNKSVPRKFLAWLKQDKKCAYCYAQVEYLKSCFNFIKPRSKGGTTLSKNKVICCKTCNDAKRYIDLDDTVDKNWILYNMKHPQYKLFNVLETKKK